MDAAIIGDPAPYHLPVPSPSQSYSSAPVNPSSIDENDALAKSTIPFTSLSSSSKVWNIQGRVIAKTNIHEYGNQRGYGKVFGFDLVNASHDEIHIFTFNELELSLFRPNTYKSSVHSIKWHSESIQSNFQPFEKP